MIEHGPTYVCVVKYPGRKHFTFGATGDLEGARHRLADHAIMHGGDREAQGYILELDSAKIVNRFKGGSNPRATTARGFCVSCGATFTYPSLDPRHRPRLCVDCAPGGHQK